MNITVYGTVRAWQLRPGAVILDLELRSTGHVLGQLDRLPTPYLIDEVVDTVDGRAVKGRPVARSDGPRRVWRFVDDELVATELRKGERSAALGLARRALDVDPEDGPASDDCGYRVAHGPGIYLAELGPQEGDESEETVAVDDDDYKVTPDA